MKKMCPKFIKPYMLGGLNLSGICVNKTLAPDSCPKNTNSKCEIITPKNRVRRVKGWACISIGKIRSTTDFKSAFHDTPCIIEVEEKYLKGAK